MQEDIFALFVEFIRTLLPVGLKDYAGLIASLPIFVLIYIFYLIVIRSVKLTFRKVGMPREASSGIIFGVRLFFFAFALLFLLAWAGDVVSTYIVAGGALLGTAIGLAFSKALSNIVSGFYVLVARPFRVGDYVRMGDSEGIVTEITLNYTRLLRPDHTRQFIPNSSTVDQRMTNFRIRVDDYFDERGLEYHRDIFDFDNDEDTRIRDAVEKLKFILKGDEVYRYTFDVELEKTCSQSEAKSYFTKICEKWQSQFILPPEYFFWNSTATTMVYRFAIIVIDPKEIFTKGQDFKAELSAFDTK
ncbi:MAG: mechanosensitive ion channel family protein [Candidatus Odinarchaeota archaeon]